MPEVKWIKILTTMFDDEKIKLIEAMPDRDTILIIWIKILTQAGRCNSCGQLVLNQNIAYTDEMLSTIFNRPLNTVRMALDIFKQFEMIEFSDNTIYISNWEKHQNIDGLEKIREQNRLRKQRQRGKQKLLPELSRDSHVPSHENHATDIELDKDKEKELTTTQKLFEILKSVENYPFDEKKDTDMINKLQAMYPTVDIWFALQAWAEYKLKAPLEAKSNARSQINTSFQNCIKWSKNLKQSAPTKSKYITSDEYDRILEEGDIFVRPN